MEKDDAWSAASVGEVALAAIALPLAIVIEVVCLAGVLLAWRRRPETARERSSTVPRIERNRVSASLSA